MFPRYERLLCFSIFLFISANAFSTDEEGEVITLRTKRQQCVCLVLQPPGQQLQCDCNNANNTPPQQTLTPQQQQQNQQDLQQELGQIQSGQCGCVMIMINGVSGGQQPQYMCDCGATGQPGQQFYNPTQPSITSTTTRATTTTTTTTTPSPIYTTTPQRPQFSNTVTGRGNNNNPCACVCISIVNGQSTYSCNCDGNNANQIRQQDQPLSQALLSSTQLPLSQTAAYGQQPQQDQALASQINAGPSFLSSVLGQSNYFGNVAGNLQGVQTSTTQNTVSNQQLNYQQPNSNLYTNNYISRDQPQQGYAEPATTTCISITAPANAQVCVCGENYVQCADNMCCHKRYRSMKEEDDAKNDNAVDLIVDVIRNIKNKLMGRH